MAVLYKNFVFSSMKKNISIKDFVIWHGTAENPLPDVSFVPPMLRRRMTDIEKISIYLASMAAGNNTNYSTVFASRFGEWRQTIKLVKQFYESGDFSPAGFSNSVHNAAAGLFSLITKNKNTYSSIAAGKNTLEMGMLDAILRDGPTLFVFAEESNPEIYEPWLDAPIPAHGIAIFFEPDENGEYVVSNGDSNAPKLTLDKLEQFLKHHDKITTTSWTLEHK